ncbi:uncharacterized protein EAF02_001855 [Botrytis sinoallii]|uniref:uncharacterized protein n=1 Tax=Botrytis sinoallii TaxID=1463999 RepID=UPI00190019AE|nr:uncharacterized protein EAF02_001855 [Botrytis sinoallii]KAF7891530.1 hypothetical protein EAF02_001855 [Botrytis sinoallii]
MRAAETQPNACPRGIFRRIRQVRPKPRTSTDLLLLALWCEQVGTEAVMVDWAIAFYEESTD